MVNKMVKTANNIFWKVKSRDKVSPARLFADSDRDGVPNVFDCRPFNKRRQDNEDNDDLTYLENELKWLKENRPNEHRAKNQIENEIILRKEKRKGI